MKKTSIWQAVACALLFTPIVAFSQKHFAVKVNAVGALLNQFNPAVEIAISPNVSFWVEYNKQKLDNTSSKSGYVLEKYFSAESKNTQINGHQLAILARYYNKEVLSGTFIEGGFLFGRKEIRETVTTDYYKIIEGWFWYDHEPEPYNSVSESSSLNINQNDTRVGIGIHSKKSIALEVSGGVDINFSSAAGEHQKYNRFATPYFRAMIGFAR